MKSLLFTFILFTSFFCCAQNRKQERMMKKAVQEKAEALQQQELKLQLLKDSADKGFPSSMYNLGMLFFEGNKVPKSYDSAVKYINRAENLGYVASMMKFGEWNQYGVPDWAGSNVQRPNYTMAQIWYKKAADLGYQPAIDKVNGYREAGDNPLAKGEEAYKNYDYKQALKYWQLASDYYNDRVAMYKISHLYHDKKLVPPEDEWSWLVKSGEHGYQEAM